MKWNFLSIFPSTKITTWVPLSQINGVLRIKPKALCMLGCTNPRLLFLPHLVSQLMLKKGSSLCLSTGTALRWSFLASLWSVLCNRILFPQPRHGPPIHSSHCHMIARLNVSLSTPAVCLSTSGPTTTRIYTPAARGLLT